ncbi:hypothetical protein MUA52_11960 [Staphylococcus agnetis]|uniref:coagulase domain-containing protein n=1 Tax=Staphylococcus agnetis TaxID=985762 RepID=UPI0021CFA7EC|nr:coagulase domain-containing protein [Staphylococcus agnetis]UXU64153.1 hypothetical protein MUA84_11725 [Staphylococcus agnetis]UXU66494.1 hypothetical protein MUA52_11960 [Staphylococcus agnetis]
MKKKLLVLSASAILASNFVFDNSASAVVRNTEHKSEALNVQGSINPRISLDRYKEHLEKLIFSQSLDKFSGYDQLEYKSAYQKYQNRFLAEIGAFNLFLLEEKALIENDHEYYFPNKSKKDLLGLTHERYQSVYNALIQNKLDFINEIEEIESINNDLKRFDNKQQEKAEREVNELENKALMVAQVFSNQQEAIEDLYNKLDMIMGYKKDKYNNLIPTNNPKNNRMLSEMKEDLETIIDEFFKDIKLPRPFNIKPLTQQNQNDLALQAKIRKMAFEAKNDDSLIDPGVKERAEKLEKAKELAKKEHEAKVREQKEKGLLRDKEFSARNYPLYFPHKKLNNNSKEKTSSEKHLIFKEDNEQPKKYPIYSVTVTSTPQSVLKQEKREEVVTPTIAPRFNQNNTLKGMTGESNLVTMDTHSNASTLSGSNDQVFDFSFESAPQTTNVAQPQTKEAVAAPTNNLAGLSGESNALNFTYDSQPVNNDTFTESNEIVLDQQTYATMSGFTKGESIEDSKPSNEVKN